MGKYIKLREASSPNMIVRTAAQTAVLMAIMTLASKLLGFVREMVMAGFFGTSYIVDAYVMAQTIPTILFAGIFGAIATAYMPLLSERIEKSGGKAANVFTSQVLNILLVISIASAIIGFLFSDQFVSILASGFTGETARLTSIFLKVTFLYTICSSTSGILDSYLQYKNCFLPQILVGYTQNIIVIGCIAISALTSHYFLTVGLLIAYIVRFILFWVLAKKKELEYTFSVRFGGAVKTIISMALPVFIGSSIQQINTFVDKTLASGLKEGSVAALNYANLLNMLIIGLTVTIMTTVIYPKLAKAGARENIEQFNEIASKGFSLMVIIALPFSLGAMLYSAQIVQIVYERGAFDVTATSITSSAYLFYSIGLVFTAVNELMVRIYYSFQDMRRPMIFSGICVIINIILNLALIDSMAHNGLALSTSISMLCNTILLYYGLRKKHKEIKLIDSKKKLLEIAIASILAVGLSYLSYIFIITYLEQYIYMRTVQLMIAVMIAGGIYLAMLHLFRIEELELVKNIFKRK